MPLGEADTFPQSSRRPASALHKMPMSKILENAIIRLLRSRPFYGHLLLNFQREERSSEKGVGVTIRSGTPVLQVDPVLFGSLPVEQQEGMIEHCLKHVLHLHMCRRKGRNSHDWDIACDLAINPGIAALLENAPQPQRLELQPGLAAEEYYDLISTPFAVGNQTGRGVGDRQQDEGLHVETGDGRFQRNDSLSTLDDHGVWGEADGTPLLLAEEVVRGMVKEAWRKSDGEVPGEIRKLVEGLVAPAAIPWRQVLRQFVATAGRTGRSATWMRPHRRFDHQTPGAKKRKRLNLLVGVDVSESTDTAELREAFARELLAIAGGRDAKITVVYANSRIRRIDSFNSACVNAETYHGGGFTDLRPVFDYARQLNPLPAAVIYLTDGIGPAPETMEFPTLWVLTKEGEKPVKWGVELRLS